MYIVIPARYASSRLPGKPLMDIAGKPMIQHVYERARTAQPEGIIIATDDERIVKAAEAFGAQAVITSSRHQSGTERIGEVVDKLGLDDQTVIVNVQGDEPDMNPLIIKLAAQTLESHKQASVGTVGHTLTDPNDFLDPNIVKIVCDQDDYALYFSRAPIPWPREDRTTVPNGVLRHIGIYAYRVEFLRRYVALPPGQLEQTEHLEQLRALENGDKIAVGIVEEEIAPTASIDTQLDLDRVRNYFLQKKNG
jgi:3-deoxy-manno-octulosonate cytidylyltransferase (CMP-KDO synthetase)